MGIFYGFGGIFVDLCVDLGEFSWIGLNFRVFLRGFGKSFVQFSWIWWVEFSCILMDLVEVSWNFRRFGRIFLDLVEFSWIWWKFS